MDDKHDSQHSMKGLKKGGRAHKNLGGILKDVAAPAAAGALGGVSGLASHFLGKKKEAISHFERLVAQQDTMPVQGHEANTYVFLGNLLEQRGETDKARATWERGLRRHPDDAQLRQKLGR